MVNIKHQYGSTQTTVFTTRTLLNFLSEKWTAFLQHCDNYYLYLQREPVPRTMIPPHAHEGLVSAGPAPSQDSGRRSHPVGASGYGAAGLRPTRKVAGRPGRLTGISTVWRPPRHSFRNQVCLVQLGSHRPWAAVAPAGPVRRPALGKTVPAVLTRSRPQSHGARPPQLSSPQLSAARAAQAVPLAARALRARQ